MSTSEVPMTNRKDRTALLCSIIVAFVCATAAPAVVSDKVPVPVPAPVVADFPECWFFPWLPWCMPPDPPNLPKPKPTPVPPAPTE